MTADELAAWSPVPSLRVARAVRAAVEYAPTLPGPARPLARRLEVEA